MIIKQKHMKVRRYIITLFLACSSSFFAASCLADIDPRALSQSVIIPAPAGPPALSLLTAEQLQWLEKHPVFRLGIVNRAPFEYIDERGLYGGLVSDYIRVITEKLGITFKPVLSGGESTLRTGFENSDMDIIAYLGTNPHWGRREEVDILLVSIPMVLLGQSDSSLLPFMSVLYQERVAVIRSSRARVLLERDYPNVTLEIVESAADGLIALDRGDVDIFMTNTFSADYFQKKLGLNNIKVVATTPYALDVSVAVAEGLEPLGPMISKAMASLSDREKRLIFDKWLNIQIEHRVQWDKILVWGGGFLFIVLLVIALILVWNRRLAVVVTKRTHELEESSRLLRNLARHTESVREDEKIRLAREIHDELGHTLTALAMGLGRLDDKAGGEGDRDLGELRHLVREASTTARRIMSDLRPTVLEDLGLVAAIEWLAREFENHYGIVCKVRNTGQPTDIDDETTTALFRITQESLTNVSRHADARLVVVSVDYGQQWLTLQVIDDGKGLEDGWEVKEGSYGVQGMRERALALGGELTLQAQPDCGVCLIVRVPINFSAL